MTGSPPEDEIVIRVRELQELLSRLQPDDYLTVDSIDAWSISGDGKVGYISLRDKAIYTWGPKGDQP
jgi:hypothetical protein